jgi:hypothetical protein
MLREEVVMVNYIQISQDSIQMAAFNMVGNH